MLNGLDFELRPSSGPMVAFHIIESTKSYFQTFTFEQFMCIYL